MLSAVANRRAKRILYAVLDHDPSHEDIRAFLGRLHTALGARGLTLCGVTTDGSALSPAPLREVCGKVRHHICQFHIVAEVVQAVVGAVASARKGLAATQPTLPKGRPSPPAAQAAARTKKRLAAQGAALFTHRYLFVQRHLNKTERKTLWRVSRGLPQLHALRAVMDQVYALFDRRCRTQTALAKLAQLRRRLQRFPQVGETLKKLFAPTLDKALTFLDDKLLPSTSNAVERGNRRYRKMQKQVYRVRTQAQVSARLALDMWREAQRAERHQTLHTLHETRAA
jgi:phage tail protein X